MVTQYYEAEVVSEYVIRGNTAVLKCNIPSFVADFVKVEAWVDSDAGEYLLTDDIGSIIMICKDNIQTTFLVHLKISLPFLSWLNFSSC